MIKRCLLLVLLLNLAAPAWAERPLIATSVHPLALIVKEIAGEEADVQALIPSEVSPHHYSMRPSERRRLAEADRIFWLGPRLEPFLEGTMSDHTLVAKTYALAEAPEEKNAGADHGHHHGSGQDPHVWLDPEQVLAMAQSIKEALSSLEGIDQQRIDRNHEQFRQRLADTEARIDAQFARLSNVALFTYHDAFHYYADHFGLTIAGTMTRNPESSPSAKHIARLQKALEAAPSPCIMAETQMGGDWWRGLDMPQSATISRWDPLGGDIRIKMGGYTDFLESLADAVSRCRPESSEQE
ncbi:zinc ABC transporter substrate-binding protein [Halomonadaceae bacterium KBTZ08]